MPTTYIAGDGQIAAVPNPRAIRWSPYCLALLFCVVSATALAENLNNIKPGLWESTMDWPAPTATERAGLEKELAKMPPDQRAKMEAAMKEVMASMAEPKRTCVTKEDVKNLNLLFGAGERGHAGTCIETIVKSTSSVWEMREDCSKANQGIGIYRLFTPNPETITLTMTVEAAPDGGGATATQPKMTTRSKWLGSDCGNVKPSSR